MDFAGRHALVTGGSSGIGLAIGRELARRGAHVHIAARRREVLDTARVAIEAARATASQHISAQTCDVASEADVAALFEALPAPPSIVVNSAGVFHTGRFTALEVRDVEHVMRVNYIGTMLVSKRAATAMVAAGEGWIQNVSSVAGLMGVYGMAAYSASKFAVTGFTAVLRAELAPRGIEVTLLCPPDTDTPMLSAEETRMPRATKSLSHTAGVLTAETVARAAIRGMRRNDAVIVPGAQARMVVLAERLAPGVVRRVSARTIRRAEKTDPY